MAKTHIDSAQKVQAFMLGVYCGKSFREAAKISEISRQTVKRCYEKAIADGFDIEDSPPLYDRYFEEGKSTGRPRKCNNDMDERISDY
ncbi:MAG: hypothetical protein M1823_006253, partial [Watsoniomyces obsoletus]